MAAYCFVVPVSATAGIVNSINIKDSFYAEGHHFFDHGEVSALVGKGLQVDQVSHPAKLAPFSQ